MADLAQQKSENSRRSGDVRPGAGNKNNSHESAETAFMEVFERVIVDEPVLYNFDGSINRAHMQAIWTWIARDLAPDLVESIEQALSANKDANAFVKQLLPDLLSRIRAEMTAASSDPDRERRMTTQLGGDEVRVRLPVVLNAMRCQPLFDKADAFGKATNTITDEAALATALQSMPLKEPKVAALLLHAVVGQSASPVRLMAAVVHAAGSPKEVVIRQSGLGPVVDACLAHAQNQLSAFGGQSGVFVDVDLMCKAVARFHRLIRAINGNVDLNQDSPWLKVIGGITKQMARYLEPKLREVSADVSQSLRRSREGPDKLDNDRLLAALNGVYLLATVRDARESLALNTLFETLWAETGRNLETLIERNMDLFKRDPSDGNTAKRLDMAIKMAEVRFNPEYAEILRRARDSAGKRGEAG